MKISVVNAIAGILSGMKINKIADKAVKNALLNDFLHLRRFVKKADEERKEIIEKFQADWKDELEDVEFFRRAGKPVEGHDAYLDAEKDANKAITDIFDEEVETSLAPVKLDAFLAACGGEELTFDQVAFLQDNGIIEE